MAGKLEMVRQMGQLEDMRSVMTALRQEMAAVADQVESQVQSQRQDLATLIEPIPITLAAIERRLARLETAVERVMMALPPPEAKDGKQVQPRLASSREVQALPERVWKAKPSMFGRSRS